MTHDMDIEAAKRVLTRHGYSFFKGNGTVYAVAEGQHDDYGIRCLFADQEDAQAHVNLLTQEGYDWPRVEELMIFSKRLEPKKLTYWHGSLVLDKELRPEPFPGNGEGEFGLVSRAYWDYHLTTQETEVECVRPPYLNGLYALRISGVDKEDLLRTFTKYKNTWLDGTWIPNDQPA